MAKKKGKLAEVLATVIGLVVTAAVANGLRTKVLVIPYVPEIVTVWTGWIVLIVAILAFVLMLTKILNK